MAPRSLRVEGDLTFASTSPDGSAGLAGTVVADGTTITVSVSGPVDAAQTSRASVRQLASALAAQRLCLTLNGPEGLVVMLGDVRAPRWQRLLTRSPFMRLGRLRNVYRIVGRSGRGAKTAMAFAPPPPTMLPLFPTVTDRGPRPVTTTHDPRGGGRPRLVFAPSPWPRAGDVQRVEELVQQRTTIGSSAECDITVDGLLPLHAVVERTDGDEYVLTHVAREGTSTVAGHPARRSQLRTGASIALGDIRLTYFREEYADHGRPYGGRLGGELGYQRPQRRPRARRRGVVGKPRTNRDPGRYFD